MELTVPPMVRLLLLRFRLPPANVSTPDTITSELSETLPLEPILTVSPPTVFHPGVKAIVPTLPEPFIVTIDEELV